MSGEKTEEPTPKRLADARKRGEVAKSRDLVAFATLAAAYVAGTMMGASGIERARAIVFAALRSVRSLDSVVPGDVLRGAVVDVAALSMPFLGAMMITGATVAYLDAGPVFAFERLAPKLDRLDPAKGASQLFSRDRFVELTKSIVVMAALFALLAATLVDAAGSLARLPSASHASGLVVLGVWLKRLVGRALVLAAGLAVADVVLSRRQHLRGLRMSKDEVKREHKESDGDPHQKGERARMHREILEHSVLESVRRADVLVVNPTHLAIALAFDVDSDQEAPAVLAKGEDSLALRMIEVARESGVPVMRDIPLARSLYELDLGDEIPELLFEAVAAVLKAAWEEREGGE